MDFAAARKNLVDSQVRPHNVTDKALIKAMGDVQREKYVPDEMAGQAYVEKDLPLFAGRWLLKARDFSKLVNGAEIKPTDLVLDVGCGFGYSTSCLSHLADMVVAIEEDDAIVAKAEQNLTEDGRDNEVVVAGRLIEGKPDQGPYDVIIIAHGVEFMPENLLRQLKQGGRLATILVRDDVGEATIFTRSGDVFGHRAIFEAAPGGILAEFCSPKHFKFG